MLDLSWTEALTPSVKWALVEQIYIHLVSELAILEEELTIP